MNVNTKRGFSRYSVFGDAFDALVKRTRAVGGLNTVPAVLSGQIFVSLTSDMVSVLESVGLKVTHVRNVLPAVVSVPRPIIGTAEYSPGDMLDLLRLNDFKFSLTPPLTGSGFNVAVIGTGIRSTHQMLGGKVVYYKNFTMGPDGDGFDHDTGVAAIIHAVIPDAGILDMKVIDSTGSGTEESVVLALEECANLQYTNPSIAPNIINLSLGSIDDNNPNNPVRMSCRSVMNFGIVVVAAAGNNGIDPGAVTVPACEEYVVGVGSMSTSTFKVSEFSSRGPTRGGLVKPDVVFLGENLIIASAASDTATKANSGTSFSTPLTTGVVVLTMEGVTRAQGMPPSELAGSGIFTNTVVIDEMLPKVCTKPEGVPAGKDNDYGYGVPVGSLMQGGAGGFYIDVNTTIGLFMLFVMAKVITNMAQKEGK